jgi:hypothetical protein
MTPGVQPRFWSSSTTAITSGVLPLPPTVMLPTTDDRDRRAPRGQDACAVEEAADRDPGREEQRERQEDQGAPAQPLPLGLEPGAQRAYLRCVVKEMWL